MTPVARAGLLALAGGLASVPAPAAAKFLDLYVGPRAGLHQGGGEGSLRGFGLGFELGAEVLLFDGFVSYTQLLGGRQSGSTLTKLLLGIDGDLPLDGRERPATFLRLGGAAGLGLVTPRAPDFPIDAKQLSHRGLVLQGTVALEHHLNPFVIVGLQFEAGYHYFLSRAKLEELARPPEGQAPPAEPASMPRLEDHYVHALQVLGLLTARVHFEPLGP